MEVIGATPQAVSVADFKRAVVIAQEETDHDMALAAYLAAAQAVVEAAARRLLTARTVRFTTWAGMGLRWFAPIAPVSAVSLVELDNGAAWVTVPATRYRLLHGHDEPQILFSDAAFGGLAELASLRITVTIGPVVPDTRLAQAIILLAKDWFDTGVAVEEQSEAAMNFGCRSLIKQARYQRPHEWRAA